MLVRMGWCCQLEWVSINVLNHEVDEGMNMAEEVILEETDGWLNK